jgi:uncharacterized protein YaeQ
MALKSTIHKAELNVADIDRHYYADHSLTLARHPSETDERMMVRLAAFVLYADEQMTFCKGLSDTAEADLWQMDLTGRIEHWIEIGLPDERAIAKACGRAGKVTIVAYGGNAAAMWWKQNEAKLARFDNLAVIRLAQESTRALAGLAERTMRLQATIQSGEIMLSSDSAQVVIAPETLQEARSG